MNRGCALIVLVLCLCSTTALAQSVTINYGVQTAVGSKYNFGVMGLPPASNTAQWQQEVNLGITYYHGSYETWAIVPNGSSTNSACLTQYQSCLATQNSGGNISGQICDPNTWNWNNNGMMQMQAAHNSGMLVQAQLAHTTFWNANLSDPWATIPNGKLRDASPLDWNVWKDMSKKIVQHFLADRVEVSPEPDTPHETTTAYQTYYQNASAAIRAVSSTVPIVGTGDLFLSSTYVPAVHSYLNGVTVHTLGGWSMSSNSIDGMNLAKSYGIPWADSTWNYEGACTVTQDNNGADSVSGTGWMLSEFFNYGFNGAVYYQGGFDYSGTNTSCAFWNGNTASAALFPKAYTWYLMSKQLGLGAGPSSVKQRSFSGVAAALGAVNSAGEPVAVIVNHNTARTVQVNLTGLRDGTYILIAYLADYSTNHAQSPLDSRSITVSGDSASYSISMPDYSVAGIILVGHGRRS